MKLHSKILLLSLFLFLLILSTGCDQHGGIINPSDLLRQVHGAQLPAMQPNPAAYITQAPVNPTSTPEPTANVTQESTPVQINNQNFSLVYV